MTAWKEQIILITGAAGGIGKVLCSHFCELGAEVIAVDIDVAGLAELEKNHQLKTLLLDCCDGKATLAGLEKLEVTGVINNAGGGRALRLRDIALDDWYKDVQLNLNAAFHVCKAVLPTMVRHHKGSLINIGSVNSFQAIGHPAYSAAKAGLEHLTKSLALEFGPKGIRANCIAPGTVATPCWQDRLAKNPRVFEQVRRWYPGGEVVQPKDIAHLAAFLLSDNSRMINGVTIAIDGGLSAGNRFLAQDLTQESFGDDEP